MCPLRCNLPQAVSGPAKRVAQQRTAPAVTLEHPQAISYSAPVVLALSVSPSLVLERNLQRVLLQIENTSPAPFRMGYGWQPGRGYGTLIYPGETKIFSGWSVPLEEIYLMADVDKYVSGQRPYSGLVTEGSYSG